MIHSSSVQDAEYTAEELRWEMRECYSSIVIIIIIREEGISGYGQGMVWFCPGLQ